MNLKDRRAAAVKHVRALADRYGESMNEEQYLEVKAAADAVDAIDAEITAAMERNKVLRQVKSFGDVDDNEDAAGEVLAKSLGEHFVKHVGERLKGRAQGERFDAAAPEFVKAAGDPFKSTDALNAFGSERLRPIVNQKRDRLVVADLMGDVAMSGSKIEYLVERVQRIAEGAANAVAEGASKPYIRYNDLDLVTESPAKIAALTKVTDEMIQDHDFVVGHINNSLVFDLSVLEEDQLLNGSGAAGQLRGLMSRSGIQTATSAKFADWADDIYKAIGMIGRATDLNADAIVMNTEDYQALRLLKDANNQYLGGGVFQGQYGQGGVLLNPPLWGLTTVVTDRIAKGTALIGAFKQGATILRKGGIRVDATNTNWNDFEKNLVTIRGEERLGLMVQRPAAFLKMTLTKGA